MEFKAKVKRVVDGDTLDVEIDLGFHLTLSERIRLIGVDTPETRTSDPVEKANGLKSKEFVTGFCRDGNVVLQVHGFGKFGRPLADLYVDGVCLNERLVDLGYAAPYFGGKR
tara:strand:- start:42 stop:377 length:336 start_codon:yes stop_codon:yes gene_type:complete